MTKKELEEKVEKLRTTFHEEVANLAEDVREKVILPLCRKYKMKFLSGNGTYFFVTKEGVSLTGNERDLPGTQEKKLFERLEPIFELLNIEVTREWALGEFVDGVLEKDLR